MTADGYEADLAYIHHVGFGGFATQAAPGVIEHLRQCGVRDGLVVDLGCGSGLLARELLDAGYDVLGVDSSASMIKLARANAPSGTFRKQSYLQVPLPACDAVTSLGECLNYLFDRSNTKARLARLFSRIHRALRPGGVFLFDVAGPGRVGGEAERMSHREGKDWAVLLRAEEDSRRNILSRHLTTFRRVGRHYRRSNEVHRLRLYRPAELAAMLRNAGFRVRMLRGYGSLRFARGHAGLLARKPC